METRQRRAGTADDMVTTDVDTVAGASSPPRTTDTSTQASSPLISALILATQEQHPLRPDFLSSSSFASSVSTTSSVTLSSASASEQERVNGQVPTPVSPVTAHRTQTLIPVERILGSKLRMPPWPTDGASTYWSSLRADEQRVGLRLFLEEDNYDKVKAADSGDKYNTRMKRAQAAMEGKVGSKFSRQWMTQLLDFWQSLPEHTRSVLIQRCREFVPYDADDNVLLQAGGESSKEPDVDRARENEVSGREIKQKRNRESNASADTAQKKSRNSIASPAPPSGRPSLDPNVPKLRASRNLSEQLDSNTEKSSAPVQKVTIPSSEEENKDQQQLSLSIGHHHSKESSALAKRTQETEQTAEYAYQPPPPAKAVDPSSSSSNSKIAQTNTLSNGSSQPTPSVSVPAPSVAPSTSAVETVPSMNKLQEVPRLQAHVERMTASQHRATAFRLESTKLDTDLLSMVISLLKQKEQYEESYAKEEAIWREQAVELQQYTRLLEKMEQEAEEWKREKQLSMEAIHGEKQRINRLERELQQERQEFEQVKIQKLAELESRRSMVWEMAQDKMREVVRLQDRIAELEDKQRESSNGSVDHAHHRQPYTSNTLSSIGGSGSGEACVAVSAATSVSPSSLPYLCISSSTHTNFLSTTGSTASAAPSLPLSTSFPLTAASHNTSGSHAPVETAKQI